MNSDSHDAESTPCLEVNPARCLFVIGPALTATRSSKDLLDSALRYLQTTKLLSFQAKRKLISEIKKNEKVDIGGGLSRAVRGLREIGVFQEWLQLVYKGSGPSQNGHCTKGLRKLLQLQKQGALLACTQIETLPGTQAVTIDDSKGLSSWAAEFEEEIVNVESEDVPSVLHLRGLFSHAESVRINGEDGETSQRNTSHTLELLLQKRLVIFIGFSEELHNPFLTSFLSDYYPVGREQGLHYPPVLIVRKETAFNREAGLFSKFLTLELPHDVSIQCNTKQNFTIAKILSEKQDSSKFQAFLLFNEKQSFRKLGEIIYHQSQSGEIYVRRDALSVVYSSGKILYSNIITYGGNGLKQLWGIVAGEGSSSLGKGLVGFGLQNAAIMWMKGRPSSLGNVTEVTTTYAGKSSTTLLPKTSNKATGQPTSMEPMSGSHHSNGIILPKNIPPPPKLIKIKPNSADNDETCSGSAGCSSQSSANTNREQVPVLLDDKGDEEYLQAIVDLHERISHRLSNGVSTEKNVPANTAAPQRENFVSFQPPMYCIAKQPELLLDIIGQTQYVKQQEHKITTVDQISVLNNHRDSLLKHSMQRSSASKYATDRGKSVKPAAPKEQSPAHKIHILDNRRNFSVSNGLPSSASKVVMTSSLPNYCLVNQIPVMLVNPTIPVMPAVNVASNASTHETPLVCYVSPNGMSVLPPENRTIPNKTSSLNRPLLSSLLRNSHKRPARPCSDQLSRKMLCVGQEPVSQESLNMFCDNSEEEDETESNNFTASKNFSSDSSVQLWIFLLDLLLSPTYRNIIHWTGSEFEFRIAQPAGLAQLWGHHRNKPQMTYEKMSRAMRYYYSRGIIESVKGRKQTFKFSLDLVKYVSSNKDKRTLDYLKSCCHV